MLSWRRWNSASPVGGKKGGCVIKNRGLAAQDFGWPLHLRLPVSEIVFPEGDVFLRLASAGLQTVLAAGKVPVIARGVRVADIPDLGSRSSIADLKFGNGVAGIRPFRGMTEAEPNRPLKRLRR